MGNEKKSGTEKDSKVLTRYKEALELNKPFAPDSRKSELSCGTIITGTFYLPTLRVVQSSMKARLTQNKSLWSQRGTKEVRNVME